MAERPTPRGALPVDAQRKLKMASQVGTPGSMVRRRAIDKAYRYVEEKYPEFLRADPAAES